MRWWFHVDMDAFYVECELKERPELRGVPVAVGPDPSEGPTRGVVLSASYEARARGVHSAMPVGRAAALEPGLRWIRADFEKYSRYSRELERLLARRIPGVSMQSIDEASFPLELEGASDAETLARTLQAEVTQELGLPCSIGVAPFRVIAKIATDQAKPRGIRVVGAVEVSAFLAPLPVGSIPGVGPKTSEVLRAAGVVTIGDLLRIPAVRLRNVLGGFGSELRALAQGKPNESERESSGPRSRSVERTVEQDLGAEAELLGEVGPMAEELAQSLAREHFRYRSVTVRVRWSDFDQDQRGRSLPAAFEGPAALRRLAERLARELWAREQRGRRRRVRMISIAASRLHPSRGEQRDLEAFLAPSVRQD
jgi:DNA polymerase IV (archaeal DinB-like DNA polymerase)